MTHINRQKFLTELSKFLTFLNEEEREKVLEKFESIFDRSANEDELLSSMDSPLKLTVEMSRAYTKGGLEEVLGMCDDLVSGQWIPDDLSDTIREQVFNAIDKETFSSIDIATGDPETPAAVNPLEDDGLVAVFEQDMKEEESDDGEETSEEYSLEPEPAAEEPAPEAEENDEAEEAQEESPEAAQQTEDVPSDEPSEEVPAEPEETPEEGSEEIPEVIEEVEEIEEITETLESEETKAAEDVPGELAEEVRKDAEIIREELEDLEPEDYPMPEEKYYKARWWALIPYAIITIPLGLIGVIICAAVTLAILAVAAALVAACVLGASLALQNGMDVVADIILVAGAALIAAGLALLVIWLAVWFASNTIGGIVGGLTRLGRKWCYKEVVEK